MLDPTIPPCIPTPTYRGLPSPRNSIHDRHIVRSISAVIREYIYINLYASIPRVYRELESRYERPLVRAWQIYINVTTVSILGLYVTGIMRAECDVEQADVRAKRTPYKYVRVLARADIKNIKDRSDMIMETQFCFIFYPDSNKLQRQIMFIQCILDSRTSYVITLYYAFIFV